MVFKIADFDHSLTKKFSLNFSLNYFSSKNLKITAILINIMSDYIQNNKAQGNRGPPTPWLDTTSH
jgi:hypothetical protein